MLYYRKSAFDMFNFLASKHRQPPEYNPNDEEEEEVQLKSARYAVGFKGLKRGEGNAVVLKLRDQV